MWGVGALMLGTIEILRSILLLGAIAYLFYTTWEMRKQNRRFEICIRKWEQELDRIDNSPESGRGNA